MAEHLTYNCGLQKYMTAQNLFQNIFSPMSDPDYPHSAFGSYTQGGACAGGAWEMENEESTSDCPGGKLTLSQADSSVLTVCSPGASGKPVITFNPGESALGGYTGPRLTPAQTSPNKPLLIKTPLAPSDLNYFPIENGDATTAAVAAAVKQQQQQKATNPLAFIQQALQNPNWLPSIFRAPATDAATAATR